MNAEFKRFNNLKSRGWHFCRFFLLFHFLVSGDECIAQQELFRAYSSRDGLVSNYPQSVCQDGDGFIWIGSDDGLSIYDGYNFENRTFENGKISENVVNGIFRKSENEMWVMHPQGTDVFIRRKWVKTIPVKHINHIFYTRNGNIVGEGYHSIFTIRNDSAHQVFAYPKVFDVLLESGKYFLAKDFADSLLLFDESMLRRTGIFQPGRLFKDRKGRIWLGDEKKLHLLDSIALNNGIIKWNEAPFPLNQIPEGYISGFFHDNEGFYWISQLNKGIFCVDEHGYVKYFSLPNGLGACLLIHFFEDVEGNVWAVGNGAMIKFFNKYTDLYSTEQGLASNHVSAVDWDARKNSVWMSHENGLACLYKNRIYNFSYPGNQVCTWTRIRLQGDSLWVGFNGLWLYKVSYQPQPKLALIGNWYPYPGKSVPGNGVSDLHADARGNMIINFYMDGIYVIDRNGKLKRIQESNLFYRFLVSRNDLWGVGLESGIAHWKIIFDKGELSADLIRKFNEPAGTVNISISEDSSHNIWVGTRSAGLLYFLKTEKNYSDLRNFYPHLGPAGNTVFSIIADQSGAVHIGTLSGMGTIRLRGHDAALEYSSNSYGFAHTIHDMTEGRDGDIWLSGTFGLARLRKRDNQRTIPPKVFLQNLFRNDQRDTTFSPSVHSGTFSYKENNLRFDFTATSFRNEDQNLFSYKLEKGGEQKEWSIPSKSHSLSLAALPPGKYHLQVKAISADNIWSISPAEYFFTVVPPFWQTWWFIAVLSLATSTLIALVSRFRMNQLRKVFSVRSTISRDLHDEVGSTLSGIGVMAEMVTKQYGQDIPIDVKKWLEDINMHSTEMLDKMSDIVWVINPQNDNLEKLVLRLKKFSELLGRNAGVSVSFNTSPDIDSHKIDMGTRKAIFLICKEAIYNSIRHSSCQNLHFSIENFDHKLKILIQDNGKGFNIDKESIGNGLKNMSDRAREINADFLINSKVGAGTTIKVEIKLT